MKKIPYLLLFCLLAVFEGRAQVSFQEPILAYTFNGTPTNGIKISTNLPFSNSSQMPTIILEGYCLGVTSSNKYASVGITLNYYIYNGSFVNYRASSFGNWNPVIKLANENNKVVIFIDSKDYFLRFNVRAFASGTLGAELPAHFDNWTATDAALTGTNEVTVPYFNAFGGRVGIFRPHASVPIPVPQAPLHVTSAEYANLTDSVSAILGSHYRHFTCFGGLTGGRIRGANEGYLALEGYKDGSDRNIYMNAESNGNILMARGGGSVLIGRESANENTNPMYKLQVLGTIGARKVKVTQETWADDALQPGYHLPSLPELAAFIRQNGHLPGIPSEKEVKAEGIDVGDMDSRLLRKIEELTLYIIKQDETNAAMKKALEEMQDKLDKLAKAAARQ